MFQIEDLVRGCHTGERHAIEQMLLRAAEYVQAVAALEVKTKNLSGLEPDQLIQVIEDAKRTSFVSLNGFIVHVEKVNRICQRHEKPLIYPGQDERKEYSDFALELVKNILEEQA